MIERSGTKVSAVLKSKKLYNIIGTLRLSWLPDSQSFVYDAIDERSHYRQYRELYRYDLKSDRVTQTDERSRAHRSRAFRPMDG